MIHLFVCYSRYRARERVRCAAARARLWPSVLNCFAADTTVYVLYKLVGLSPVGASFLLAAGALKTLARNGYNA